MTLLERAARSTLVRTGLRFLTGGGLVFLFKLAATELLSGPVGMDPVVGYRLVLVATFVIYFFMNLFFIFKVRDRIGVRLAKYAAVSMTFLSFDGALMQFLHRVLGVHHLLALSVSTALLLGFKFIIFHFLVFQPSKPGGAEGPDLPV